MSDQPKKKSRACPDCGKQFEFTTISETPNYPFCSERCKMADLGSWLSEDYQVVEKAEIYPQRLDGISEDSYWAGQ